MYDSQTKQLITFLCTFISHFVRMQTLAEMMDYER